MCEFGVCGGEEEVEGFFFFVFIFLGFEVEGRRR